MLPSFCLWRTEVQESKAVGRWTLEMRKSKRTFFECQSPKLWARTMALLCLICSKQGPGLTWSILKVTFQMTPLDMFSQEPLCIKGHTTRITPFCLEAEFLCQFTVPNLAVIRATGLER